MTRPKTFQSECRKFFPGCSAKEASDLFWNATAFPAADLVVCREQLKQLSQRSNRDPQVALALADADLRKILSEMR